MTKVLVDKRPWGMFEQFTLNEKTTVKLLHVKAGKRLSYQYHLHRSEDWKVISGKIRVVLNGKKKILSAGGAIHVPVKAKHRIEGIKDSVILEIAHGKFDEKDIIRISDDYNRSK